MIYVRTPATSANLGCGFDTIGMAFKMYNEMWIEEADCKLEIRALKQEGQIPKDESNLIYKTIVDFYEMVGKRAPGVRIYQKDEIPMTRGLGSSAACIVSGLMAANELSGASLSREEIVQLASKIEGHPDNVVPSLLGGLVVGAQCENELKYVRLDLPKDLRFAVMIPDFLLSTEKARGILPKQVPHKDAVFNCSRTGLLIASIMTGKYENLNVAFDDKLHQPYREKIIPDMDNIFRKSKEYGAKGVFLSGAGPTIISVISDNDSFESNMASYIDTLKSSWTLNYMDVDDEGASLNLNRDLPKIKEETDC